MTSTFNIIPNIGIEETWDWQTDILTTHNSTEQRLSIRPRPRIGISADFGPLTQVQRRALFEVVQAAIKVPTNVPLWQYSSPITETTSSGNDRIYFDVSQVPVAQGGILVLTNIRTGVVFSRTVSIVHADGATLTSNISVTVDSSFIVSLGMLALVDKPRFSVNQITADLDLKFKSFVDPQVERPGSSASLETFDSLPLLDRTFLADSEEIFEYDAELIDFGGVRQYNSRHPYADYVGNRTFLIDRVLSSTDFDYWRRFFNTVKGSWKPFLISTQMEDLTTFSGLTQNATAITVTQRAVEALSEAFRRVEIIYGDGTKSRHRFTTRTVNVNETVTFGVTPNIPNDPKVSSVRRISYLLKCRMGDTVRMSHGPLRSEVSFEIRTTDQG